MTSMEILLVRHGQTPANIDKAKLLEVADHAIPLSDLGHRQADADGLFLDTWIDQNWPGIKPRIWHSPYLRAAQTTQGIATHLGDRVESIREHVLLAEQQFGLFDGLTDEQCAERYPEEWAHYDRCERFNGRFWARLPLGESRFDLAQRVHQSFGTFHRDAERHAIEHLIVVCHGATLRAFVMMWLHLPVAWFEAEPNPKNGAIRHLIDDADLGYIFEPHL